MALVLAAMSLTAGAVSLLAVLTLSAPTPVTSVPVVGTMATPVAAGAIMILRHRFGERLPVLMFHGWIAMASALICLAARSQPTPQMAVASVGMLVWMALFAGHFFSTRQLLAHLAWMGASVAVLVAADTRRITVPVGITAFATVAAAAMASRYMSVLLRRVATTDSLTGLPNRQALDELIEREVARSTRFGTPLSVAIMDVDRFKEVNDSDGHIAGDILLAALATNLRRDLRAVDVLARFGGDEFVALMPGCALEDAASSADRLRETAGHPCSIGVSAWAPGDTASTLLLRADRALYQAKHAGRDCVKTLAANIGAGPSPGDPLAC